MDNQDVIPSRGREGICSIYHHVQTNFRAHSDSYPIGTRESFLGCKVARA